jgi:hypothetical protein
MSDNDWTLEVSMSHWRTPHIPRPALLGRQGRRFLTLGMIALASFTGLYWLIYEKHLFEFIQWLGRML